MDQWTGWAAAILAFIFSILGINYRTEKKRYEENAKECVRRDNELGERLARVETELMTEKEVRQILKDYFDPLISGMQHLQTDIQEIKIQLASLPKRKGD